MKLRKNLKILKAGIHQAYGLKNAQFYDVQAKIMRKYIAFGWSVHEWLLRSKHALRNHLAVVEELVPTISGVTRRKLEGIFSPENEFSLNWAENMYEILKREVPDYQNLSYKEFMKIADLSMVDCENPPKPKKTQSTEILEVVADDNTSIDAFLHNAQKEYTEELKTNFPELTNLGRLLLREVEKQADHITPELKQKIDNALKNAEQKFGISFTDKIKVIGEQTIVGPDRGDQK